MLKLVSFHIQTHLNAFLQILEYFFQICLGPLVRESPCIYFSQNNYRVILSLEAPNKFGKSIPEFGETHSSVPGCERRPVSASIMSRSCFASFPVCVYKFSSHYLNNIIFYRQQFGTSRERITLHMIKA